MSTRSRRQWLQPHMVHATDSMSTQVSLILQECSLVTRSSNPELSVLVCGGIDFIRVAPRICSRCVSAVHRRVCDHCGDGPVEALGSKGS